MERVRLKDLSFRYRGGEEAPPVLRGLDTVFHAGEFTVIAGHSGAGKTSLLACINGIARWVYDAEISGEVLINGASPEGLPVGEIARTVGTVLQDAESQLFNLRAEDEIAFGCENLGFPKEKIEERITLFFHLLDIEKSAYVSRLSGGWKQRLLLGSVLAMDQDILLLDEPLANIDREGTDILLHYLRELTSLGKTVIMVEHRLDVILSSVDRLLWLEEGRIQEDLNREAAVEWFRSKVQEDAGRTSGGVVPDVGSAGREKGEGRERREPFLELRDVYGGYGKKAVLFGIGETFIEGDNTVILGGNGSGKTTFLKLLGGVLKPLKGSIIRSDVLKGIGYVFQNPGRQLFMETVQREVGFLSPNEENTDYILQLFGLTALAERHPLSLSEGQKRLVTAAAASASRPKLLLLDEPTVGQDYRSLHFLFAALRDCANEFGTTIIFTTHDYRAAFTLAERTLILEEGRITASGGRALAERYFANYHNKNTHLPKQ